MKKISEMNSVEFSRIMCMISAPAERLFSDPEVLSMLERMRDVLKESRNAPFVFMARSAATVVPVLLGDGHRDDVFTIAAALKGVSIDEIRKQTGVQTIRDMWDIFTGDHELMTFFLPVQAVRSGEREAGSVQARDAAND